MKKKSFRRAAAAAALCVLLLAVPAVCGCASRGEELCSLSVGDRTYTAYGHATGISSVIVSGDGEIEVRVGSRINVGEPYTDTDGQNYGLIVCDADGDGDDDLVICASRTEGMEKYRFFLRNSKGGYTESGLLSALTAPTFGDGKVTATEQYRVDDKFSIPGTPPMYTVTRVTRTFASDGKDGVICTGAEELSYYSEGNIYCVASYRPAGEDETPDDAEYGLVIADERWIPAERIADHGIEPLE